MKTNKLFLSIVIFSFGLSSCSEDFEPHGIEATSLEESKPQNADNVAKTIEESVIKSEEEDKVSSKEEDLPSSDVTSDITIDYNRSEEGKNEENLNLQSLESFTKNLHPLLTQNCGACHGKTTSPFFAVDDAKEAFKTTTVAGIVDTKSPEISRLVKRLTVEGHNCWGDCNVNGTEMGNAISLWLESAGDGDEPEEIIISSNEVSIDQVDYREIKSPPGTYVVQAEDAISRVEEITVKDATASNGFAVNFPSFGTKAYYAFSIPEDGLYYIWGRAKRTSRSSDSLYYYINGGSRQTWVIPLRNQYIWGNVNGDATTGEPFELKKGRQIIQFDYRRAGSTLDMVALTNDETFRGASEANSGTLKVLEFSLSEHFDGKDVRLEFEVDDSDEKTIVFKNPRLIASSIFEAGQKIYFKSLNVAVNGKSNVQYSTYSGLEKEVADDKPFSESSLLVIRKYPLEVPVAEEKEAAPEGEAESEEEAESEVEPEKVTPIVYDKISFTFEALELRP